MDIDSIMEKDNKKLYRSWLPIAVGVGLILVLAYWYISSSDSSVTHSNIQEIRVQQGSIPKTVNAYGRLRSKTTRMLTASSEGIIEEINRFPGEQVASQTVILRLSNPELELQLAEVQLELSARQFEFDEFRHTSALSEMENNGEVEKIKLEISNQETLRNAKEHLVKLGIIPEYEFLLSESELEQNRMLLRFLQDKQEQLKLINGNRVNIRLTQIEQQERRVALYQDRVSQANLQANMQGVVQELHVEVGQSVNPGDKLVMVSSAGDLVAEIQVLQREASLISIGDFVSLDTYGSKGTGEVTRIDPTVINGRVMVEVALIGDLPNNARPELTVSASIEVDTVENALFVNNNRAFTPGISQSFHILDQEGTSATMKPIQFGEELGNLIIINDGLSQDDTIVIFTDGKSREELETIRIDNE